MEKGSCQRHCPLVSSLLSHTSGFSSCLAVQGRFLEWGSGYTVPGTHLFCVENYSPLCQSSHWPPSSEWAWTENNQRRVALKTARASRPLPWPLTLWDRREEEGRETSQASFLHSPNFREMAPSAFTRASPLLLVFLPTKSTTGETRKNERGGPSCGGLFPNHLLCPSSPCASFSDVLLPPKVAAPEEAEVDMRG